MNEKEKQSAISDQLTDEELIVIEFEDHGQDFITWVVDRYGKVVDCQPFQYWIWTKKEVLMETLQVGQLVDYFDPTTGDWRSIKYPVKSITKNESQT